MAVVDTRTGEILDLSPLRKQPAAKKVPRVQYHQQRPSDDAVLLLAGLNLLTLTIVLVA